LLGGSSRQFLGDSEVNDQVGNEGSRKRPAPTEEHRAEGQEQGHKDSLYLEDMFLTMSSYGKLAHWSQRNQLTNLTKFFELDVNATIWKRLLKIQAPLTISIAWLSIPFKLSCF
jgi:hypothetical protein